MEVTALPPNVRDQRRRAVGAPLAKLAVERPLAVLASGVTTSAERCIALLDGIHHSLSLTAGEHLWRYDRGSPIRGKEWCAPVAAIQASADQ